MSIFVSDFLRGFLGTFISLDSDMIGQRVLSGYSKVFSCTMEFTVRLVPDDRRFRVQKQWKKMVETLLRGGPRQQQAVGSDVCLPGSRTASVFTIAQLPEAHGARKRKDVEKCYVHRQAGKGRLKWKSQ